MKCRVLHNPLNGRSTVMGYSYEDARPQEDSNYWSVTEYNQNNAWNVNFGTGGLNNNNKYNGNVVRAVAAHDGLYGAFYLSVVEAYKDCLQSKMSSSQALEYMSMASEDLPRLALELWGGTYKPTTSTCFLVTYPKLREVFAASFRDRIVHHWICLRLEPLFEQRFVNQGNVSFNCRKGFGTDKCILHCVDGMERVSDNYRKKAWVFKGDIHGFFMSIDKSLLWYLLERFIKRHRKKIGEKEGMYWDMLLRTARTVVMHHPEEDCVLNSPMQMWEGLEKGKSMFGNGEKGEPIGNLTTQLFANFFLSFFDSYVQYMFRGKNYSYARFVDDWVVVCDDLSFLLESVPKMGAFLRKMGLEMHKDKRYIQPVSHGVAFVGSYIKPHRVYLSNRTLARFKERAVGFARIIDGKKELSILDCKRIEQVINSYLGFCKGKRTYRKRREILGMMGKCFFKYFFIRGHYQSIRTRRKYREIKIS